MLKSFSLSIHFQGPQQPLLAAIEELAVQSIISACLDGLNNRFDAEQPDERSDWPTGQYGRSY